MNIRYRSSYERLLEKVVWETCKFFIHPPRHITLKDRIAFSDIKSGLRSFQALGIFFMLKIEMDKQSGNILADKIGYRKVRYLIFEKYITNLIRRFNV